MSYILDYIKPNSKSLMSIISTVMNTSSSLKNTGVWAGTGPWDGWYPVTEKKHTTYLFPVVFITWFWSKLLDSPTHSWCRSSHIHYTLKLHSQQTRFAHHICVGHLSFARPLSKNVFLNLTFQIPVRGAVRAMRMRPQNYKNVGIRWGVYQSPQIQQKPSPSKCFNKNNKKTMMT